MFKATQRTVLFFCIVTAVAGLLFFIGATLDPPDTNGWPGDPGAAAALLALCAAALLFLCLWDGTPVSILWKAVAAVQTLGVAYLWYADELSKKANDPAVALDILAYIIGFSVIVGFVMGIIWLGSRNTSTPSSGSDDDPTEAS